MTYVSFRVAAVAWRTLPIALASSLALGCLAENVGPLDRRAPAGSGAGQNSGGNGTPGAGSSGKNLVAGGIEGSQDATSSQSTAPGGGASPGTVPLPLTLSPATMALFVPPPDGNPVLFEPIAGTFWASGSTGTYYWHSSAPGVARISAQGTVTAGRAGTAVVTVSTGTDTATAAVTVGNKARLVIKPAGGMPGGGASMAIVVSDEASATLHDGPATADLTVLGGLRVQALAHSQAGSAVAAGRWIGLSLLPGVANEFDVPMNRPSLTTVQGGGRGAAVDLLGDGFSGWAQGHSSAHYDPPIAATVGGSKALVQALSPTRAHLFVPQDLPGGSSGTRELVFSVGGVPLVADFHVVESLEILSPPATLSVGGSWVYAAAASDASGDTVSPVALTWELLGGTEDAPAPGSLAGSTVTATATGSAVVRVRTGSVVATASFTVLP